MIRWMTLAGLLAAALTPSSPRDPFDVRFSGDGLRVDFHHTGDAASESATLDRVLRQGEWGGPRTRLVDPSPLGAYRAEMWHADGAELLFATSFDSLFGEYRTTAPAAGGVAKTFHETVVLPMPKVPVTVRIVARANRERPVTLLEVPVDPADPLLPAEPPRRGVEIFRVVEGPPPEHAVDLVILGEGYVDAERFEQDLRRAVAALFAEAPYAQLRDRFTVTGLLVRSAEPGCDAPRFKRWRETPFGASFNAFGSARYLLTESNRAIRDVAANVPYDTLVIMVDEERYGGGGIYNLYATFTAGGPRWKYVFLHEFGHSFAALADEYFASPVAYSEFYPAGREPPEPNITALLDAATLSWGDLVANDVPLPTPWDQSAYLELERQWQADRKVLNERIEEAARGGRPEADIRALRNQLEARAARATREVTELLSKERHAGRVGAFEGAGYVARGLYRPSLECLMFTAGTHRLCPVCRRAVEARIRFLTE